MLRVCGGHPLVPVGLRCEKDGSGRGGSSVRHVGVKAVVLMDQPLEDEEFA